MQKTVNTMMMNMQTRYCMMTRHDMVYFPAPRKR